MHLIILTSLATAGTRAYGPGDKVFWTDKVDAERLIAAGFARLDDSTDPKAKR